MNRSRPFRSVLGPFAGVAMALAAPALAQQLAPTVEPPPQQLLPSTQSRTGVQARPIPASASEFVHPDYVEASNYARAEAEGVRAYFNLPGLSAGVLLNGEIVWMEGFGSADLEAGTPVTPDTRFRVGSLSKPLTTLGMAILAERGELDLDAPIQTYVPSFPMHEEGDITCRLIAGHLSGIRHYRPGESDTVNPRRYETLEDAMSRFASDPLVAPPGFRYSYSTYAFTLLSAAMENAAGAPFLDIMQGEVFDPIHMGATSADRSDGNLPNLTSFYDRARDSSPVPARPIDTSYKWAGGGFVSTTGDLLRFANEMMHPTLISEATRDEMWSPMTTTRGERTHYGMGWGLDTDEFNRRVIAHSGGQVGCTAYILIFPELDAASVVLCNITRAEFGRDLAVVLAEAFIRQRDRMEGEGGSGEAQPAGAGEQVGR
ncbi:MAG: beta-lactamase family protein [Phycisphaerales bacterium]|nr:beta-lactamase family protein [Phycisphaerales bacterium]